jgi:sortase A
VRRALRLASAAWLGAAAVAGAQALWIPAKAALAQVLLEDAWRRARAGETRPVPWPWADAWPVARLVAPDHDRRLVVLSDASGRALAFAPGHLSGTAAPGAPGTSVVAGHRDTHFAFLREMAPGDRIEVEDATGRVHRYRVVETAVVGSHDARVAAEAARDRLALVTCWPFDAIRPGGDLRWVVLAEREPRPPVPPVGRGTGTPRAAQYALASGAAGRASRAVMPRAPAAALRRR